MFTERVAAHSGVRTKGVLPLPSIEDRAFWDGLTESVRAMLVEAGVARLGYRYPCLPASLYLDFSRTGNRVRYEEPYFDRRRALNDLVLAECVEAKGRFLDGIVDGIDALLSEAGWQLPAHNSYVRDTPQLPLPDPSRPVLDLFACETGAQLSMVSGLLGRSLDEVSPVIAARMATAVRERILTPYLNDHFWWMGDGDEPMCNWTPWCTQNVLLCAAVFGAAVFGAAAIGAAGSDRTGALIDQAAYSLDCFLKDYGDDGCCSEGAQYYRHAGLCLFGAMEFLDILAPGAFSALYGEAKIRNMAQYIQKVHVAGDYYVNFADCSPLAGPAGVREFLFGKRIGSAELQAFAAEDWARQRELTGGWSLLLGEEINLFYRLQALMTIGEIEAYARSAGQAPRDGATDDAWYPSVGLLVTRSKRLCLAVKAGGNGDSHNHNDTGSFTLYKDGRPCLIDIGVETYTAKTFSPQRYEIWTMQSAWHNLPTFGPYMQEPGAQHAAADVVYRADSSQSSLSMELSGAWGEGSGVSSFTRRVSIHRESERVCVEDRYPGRERAVLSLITELRPSWERNRIHVGALAVIDVVGASGSPEIERILIQDPRLAQAWHECIYRVKIPFREALDLSIY